MDFKLGFNIDHIATLRNARNEGYPNLLRAAGCAIKGGATQITAHLREDRRHIKDNDIYDLKAFLDVDLNLEIAPTSEMINIACTIKPHSVCLVPERRQELTTEGGLDIIGNFNDIYHKVAKLKDHNIKVSLFLDSEEQQIITAFKLPIDAIEINTGNYSNVFNELFAKIDSSLLNSSPQTADELIKHKEQLRDMIVILKNINYIAKIIKLNYKEAHAGHGLNFYNIKPIASIIEFSEFNIGHFLVSESVFIGLQNSITKMISLIKNVRQ